MKKKALITGCTGQDGSHLIDFLLEKEYDIYGIRRRSSTFNTSRIDHVFDKINLFYGDLTDYSSIENLILKIKPDEIYNLAAQSHVAVSFEVPIYTSDVVSIGALKIFEAVRKVEKEINKTIKIYQASSSEMFGSSPPPQSEETEFKPRSPYGVSKVSAYLYGKNYREAYGMFIANGILFNHEGERRGENFVTRKITRAIGRIKYGIQKELRLGNLEAKRDWGYAKDYVEMMYLMLQLDKPDDFVIASGEAHTVKEFVEIAFDYANLDWKKHVITDNAYCRPTEVDYLCGNISKAKRVLNWTPKTKFKDLIKIMVDHDINLAKHEKLTM